MEWSTSHPLEDSKSSAFLAEASSVTSHSRTHIFRSIWWVKACRHSLWMFWVISRRKSLIFCGRPLSTSPYHVSAIFLLPFYIIRTQMAFTFWSKSFVRLISLTFDFAFFFIAFRLDVKWETFLWIKYSNDDSRMKRTETEKGIDKFLLFTCFFIESELWRARGWREGECFDDDDGRRREAQRRERKKKLLKLRQ